MKKLFSLFLFFVIIFPSLAYDINEEIVAKHDKIIELQKQLETKIKERSELVRQKIVEMVKPFIETLPEQQQQQQMMRLRFGLIDGKVHSKSEIAKIFKISDTTVKGFERILMNRAGRAAFGNKQALVPLYIERSLPIFNERDQKVVKELFKNTERPHGFMTRLAEKYNINQPYVYIIEYMAWERMFQMLAENLVGETTDPPIDSLVKRVGEAKENYLVFVQENLKGALRHLTPQQSKALSYRYGLYDGRLHTIEETAEFLDIDSQNISQFYDRASATIKQRAGFDLPRIDKVGNELGLIPSPDAISRHQLRLDSINKRQRTAYANDQEYVNTTRRYGIKTLLRNKLKDLYSANQIELTIKILSEMKPDEVRLLLNELQTTSRRIERAQKLFGFERVDALSRAMESRPVLPTIRVIP